MQLGKVTLKDSVYVAVEPVTGAPIAMRGATPKLVARDRLHLATIVPATPERLQKLAAKASIKLAGIPHEIQRVDAL